MQKDRVRCSKPFNPNDPEENPEAFMPSKVIQGQISKKDSFKSSSSSKRSSNADSTRSIKNMESYSDKSSSNNSAAIPQSRSHRSMSSSHRSMASPVHGSQTSSHVSSDNGSIHQKPASLPKFGDWKETDKKPEDGSAVIFNEFKGKKQNGATNFLPVPTNATIYQQQKENQGSSSKKICCFFPRTRE